MAGANAELLEMKQRIDQHVAAVERSVCDAVATLGASGAGVEALLHTRDQARKHQARLAGLIEQTVGRGAERLVEGGSEKI